MVIPYLPLSSKRVQSTPPMEVHNYNPFNSDARFDEITTLHIYYQTWNIYAKVLFKAHIRETRHGTRILRVILADPTGTRMEALAYAEQADRFNESLRTGLVYAITNVGFEPADMPLDVVLAVSSSFFISLRTCTVVHAASGHISIPILPPRFMDFQDVYNRPDRTLTDIIGLVVYVSDIAYQHSYDRRTPSRYIAIMNMRRELLFVRVLDQHVGRHITRWRPAEREFWALAATQLEVNRTRGGLTTTYESQFVFQPDTPLAYELEGFRAMIVASPGQVLRCVNAALQLRN